MSSGLRLLFVSGVGWGGSARSTLELAGALARRGNEVAVVLGSSPAHDHGWFQRGVNAWVKLSRTPLEPALRYPLRYVGRHLDGPEPLNGARVYRSPVPENAYARLLRAPRPDAVVVSSLSRAAWRWVRHDLVRAGVPSVLYLREAHAIGHLAVSRAPADLVLANAASYAERLRDLGYACEVVPSLVVRDEVCVDSTRERVLYVNPVPEQGLEHVLQLAERRPAVPFVFQESWPLSDGEWAALGARASGLGNVSLRRRAAHPATIYRDARLLVVPPSPGRPRVVLEAHHNGIPVLGADLAPIREIVGQGGILVAEDAGPADWGRALDQLWEPGPAYDSAVEAALANDRRPELQPDAIVDRFEHLVAGVARR
ncbi:MAG: glycosyltransferase [Acidimicrobiales bacterium]